MIVKRGEWRGRGTTRGVGNVPLPQQGELLGSLRGLLLIRSVRGQDSLQIFSHLVLQNSLIAIITATIVIITLGMRVFSQYSSISSACSSSHLLPLSYPPANLL